MYSDSRTRAGFEPLPGVQHSLTVETNRTLGFMLILDKATRTVRLKPGAVTLNNKRALDAPRVSPYLVL